MSQTEPEIVARASAGEEEAFRMLVELHSRSVFRLAYRLTGNESDAEEAVQETFLRVFRRLSTFQQSARFETWLYRVASNASMDVIRRRQRHHTRQTPLETEQGAPRPLEAPTPAPDRVAVAGQIGDRVAAALDCLTPGERAAFTLRHLQGFSINEIGEALGLRSNAVKNAIFRAVTKMRRELAPLAGSTR